MQLGDLFDLRTTTGLPPQKPHGWRVWFRVISWATIAIGFISASIFVVFTLLYLVHAIWS